MRERFGIGTSLLAAGRGALVAALCSVLVGQPVMANAAPAPKRAKKKVVLPPVEIQGDARALHALNRLTFGPRPGDVKAVEAMGLDKWFEQQLNPSGIDDSVLEAKLAQYPAMHLTQADLMQRFPEPGMIRRMAKGDLPLPSDPTLHAVYADEIAFYDMKLKADAAKNPVAPVDGAAAGNGMDPNAPAMAAAAPKKNPARQGAKRFRDAVTGTDGMGGSDGMGMAASAAGPAPVVRTDGSSAMGDDAMAGGMQAAPVKPAAVLDPLGPQPAQHDDSLYAEDSAQRLLALDPDQRFHAVLAMQPKDLMAFRRSLSRRETQELAMGMTPEQKETMASLAGPGRVIGGEVLQTRLLRDVYSDRQLEAVMTDFWLNHFNVYVKKNQTEPYLLPAYERDVIRPNALGKFEDLLVATAKSPAMLVYLDNAQSVGPDSRAVQRGGGGKGASKGLNENYGRELMELHTLGVGGGYTQADVTQVAKVFTGWSVDPRNGKSEFLFTPNRHEPGAKTVLGQTIQENGENEGLQVLHMLATSPATAKFISTKLAVRFVSDDPPPALVDRMADAFLTSGGDIKVVLRTMFHSPEFWAPAAERAKVKTPLEFVVSAVRASDAEVKNPQALVQALDRLGMPLYGMQTPNGYSWKQDEWVSTGALVTRMNFALLLSADRVPGVRTEWPELLDSDGAAPVVARTVAATTAVDPVEAAKERKLEMTLLGEPVSDRTRATVLAQFNDPATRANAEAEFNAQPGGMQAGNGDMAGARGYGAGRRGGGFGSFGPQAGQAGPQDLEAAGMAGLLLGSPEFQRR
jgi:uncharacterized protein (DUF1800 family)